MFLLRYLAIFALALSTTAYAARPMVTDDARQQKVEAVRLKVGLKSIRAAIEGVNRVRGGVVLYDSYGSTSWDKLKSAIRHAVLVEGCKDIVIDPLTRLTIGMDSAEANTELERISDELSSMAKDLGFFYMIFCHLKAPTTGQPHERGGR